MAREIVSLVASAAARSRSKLPVSTDWLVTRKVRMSDTDCARAAPANAIARTLAANTARVDCCLVIFQLFNPLGLYDAAELLGAGHGDVLSAFLDVGAVEPLVFGGSVGGDAI